MKKELKYSFIIAIVVTALAFIAVVTLFADKIVTDVKSHQNEQR